MTKIYLKDDKDSTKPRPVSAMRRELATWREIVLEVMTKRRDEGQGAVPLPAIYAAIEGHPKCATNPTWRATVRRTLQQLPEAEAVRKGVWRLKS